MKILIVLTGGVGNALMFTPALEILIKKYSPNNNEYFLLTSKLGADKILKESGYFKEIFIYNHNSKFSFLILFLKILFFKRFDVYISSMGLAQFKSGFLAIASKARLRCAESNYNFFFTHCVKPNWQLHEVERNFEIVNQLTKIKKEEEALQLKFYFNDRHLQETQKILNNLKMDLTDKMLIGMHIGSNDFLDAKRWKIDNFKKLISKILDEYKNSVVILFGGKNEIEYSLQIEKQARIINLVGKTSLPAAGLLIKRCKVFISNDSGLMHLAVAAGIRIIALFGPTIIEKNRPYHPNSIVLSKKLECSPCYKYNQKINCPRNYECMKSISVTEVFNELKKIMQSLE